MEDINFLAVAAATVAQFIVGMLWYGVIFSKAWGQIHGFDKLSKEEQQKMAGSMGPWYGLQLVVTILTALVLAIALRETPNYSPYAVATVLWLGFALPTQYSDIAFGGTESTWMLKKMLISLGGTLVCFLVGAAVLQAF